MSNGMDIIRKRKKIKGEKGKEKVTLVRSEEMIIEK